MDDLKRFEVVLSELADLWLALGDLSNHLMVIGGQVIALEARRRGGDGVIRVETSVGPVLERGYSLDLDLLYDGDTSMQEERLPDILRSRGFVRSSTYRWTKLVGDQRVDIDLLNNPEVDAAELPVPMTPAHGAEVALRRPRQVDVTPQVRVAIPSPLGFLALKTEARKARPTLAKDSFDVFAYVHLMSAAVVAEALEAGGADGERIRGELRLLFADEQAQGVRDVLEYAGTLEADERALLARSVIDLMAAAAGG